MSTTGTVFVLDDVCGFAGKKDERRKDWCTRSCGERSHHHHKIIPSTGFSKVTVRQKVE
jgi:hypothetical protein